MFQYFNAIFEEKRVLRKVFQVEYEEYSRKVTAVVLTRLELAIIVVAVIVLFVGLFVKL